jgi:hypothetical protein
MFIQETETESGYPELVLEGEGDVFVRIIITDKAYLIRTSDKEGTKTASFPRPKGNSRRCNKDSEIGFLAGALFYSGIILPCS